MVKYMSVDNNINTRKEKMNQFLQNLEREEEQARINYDATHTPEYKLGELEQCKQDAKEKCAAKVIATIYTDALPLSKDYKSINRSVLDDRFLTTIKSKPEANGSVYNYITGCAKKGSKPAKLMLEAVDDLVEKCAIPYYENLDQLDPDDIDLGPDSKDIQDGIKDISDKMNYVQVSKIIENNVKDAIVQDVNDSKEEEKRLNDLEQRLIEDDKIQTETDIDAEIEKAGFGQREYDPSLFTGIMVGNTTRLGNTTNLDAEHLQKKAFVESVKEYTMLETLHTLNMETIDIWKEKNLAGQYARCEIFHEDASFDMDEIFAEGANLEALERFKQDQITIKQLIRDANNAINRKDKEGATIALDKASEVLESCIDMIAELDYSIGSILLGFFAQETMDNLKTLGAGILIPGIGALVMKLVIVIRQLKGIMESANQNGQLTIKEFNLYKNNLLGVLVDYRGKIDALRQHVEKKL